MKKVSLVLLLLPLLAGLSGCIKQDQSNKMDTTQLNKPIQSEEVSGFIHTVFFWLREDITDAERAAFLRDLNKLRSIETIRMAYVGKPANTPREVVDNSYDYAWIVHFADAAGQNVYQEHPVHLQFVEAQQQSWTRVQVYDAVLE